MDGWMGKILKIDLTTESWEDLEVSPDILKKFVGGRALGARLLYDYLEPGVDPLGPENKILVLTGPATGTIVPNGSKYVIVTKSPQTGGFLDAYSSGYIATELKNCGYDGVLIEGKAQKPSYIKIYNQEISIEDAADLWGKDAFTTEEEIKRAFGEEDVGIMAIGPAGEKLCKFATINSELYRQAARGGGGAVMGSKNLKGMAVWGTGGIKAADNEKLLAKLKNDFMARKDSKIAQGRMKYGTPMTLNITNEAGMLPTRNFQTGVFPGAEDKLGAEGVAAYTVASRGCYGCITPCSKVTKVSKGKYKGEIVEGPEYESLGLLGSNLGIDYLPAVIKANRLCDQYGIDTISTGGVVGWAMECYEKGILSREEVDGLDLRFGNDEVALALIEKIGKREGIGDLLAEGVKIAAERVGKGSEKFAMHSKGMEFPAYDPRAAFGAGLTYAVTPRGACHRRAWPPAVEVLGGVEPFTVEGKAEIVRDQFNETLIFHSLLICDFPGKFIPISIKDYAEYLTLLTGLEYTEQDLMDLAERSETQIRLFNNREGKTRNDDTLPERVFADPLPDGPPSGQSIPREGFEKMLTEYYHLRGWDGQGIPRASTIEKLGL